jgi:hypothetical protein
MKTNFPLLYSKDEVVRESKHHVYETIVIDAPPSKVRQGFMDFEKWQEWNSVIDFKIVSGDIDGNLAMKPRIKIGLDIENKGVWTRLPISPVITLNDEFGFGWGVNFGWFARADHVFLFESIEDGKMTRLHHYEIMDGCWTIFTSNQIPKMRKAYIRMNMELKYFIEKQE